MRKDSHISPWRSHLLYLAHDSSRENKFSLILSVGFCIHWLILPNFFLCKYEEGKWLTKMYFVPKSGQKHCHLIFFSECKMYKSIIIKPSSNATILLNLYLGPIPHTGSRFYGLSIGESKFGLHRNQFPGIDDRLSTNFCWWSADHVSTPIII